MSHWDHFTQDVLIVVFQLSTLWCEHHPATFVPLRSASFLPSVLILSAVLTSAKRVALNMTVPSLFSGIFMETRRCGVRRRKRTIILATYGLKHALPHDVMMPSRPAVPLTWAAMACGFSYRIIKVLVVSTYGPNHVVFALGSPIAGDSVFFSVAITFQPFSPVASGHLPTVCYTDRHLFQFPNHLAFKWHLFFLSGANWFLHTLWGTCKLIWPALKLCLVQIYINRDPEAFF